MDAAAAALVVSLIALGLCGCDLVSSIFAPGAVRPIDRTNPYDPGSADYMGVALLNPAADAVTNDTSPLFTWEAKAAATSYHLQLATAPDFAQPMVEATGLTAASYQLSGSGTELLADQTTFRWRVRYQDVEHGWGIWGETRGLTVRIDPPTAVTFGTGGVLTPDSALVDWEDVSGASTYALQIGTTNDFSGTLVVDEAALTASRYQVAAYLDNAVSYRARLKVRNEDSVWGAWGQTWTFTTSGYVHNAWVTSTQQTPWGARFEYALTVHGSQLVMAGGWARIGDAKVYSNDVWVSSDGVEWTQVAQSCGWVPRSGLSLESSGTLMFLIGGFMNGTTFANDVWSSADGREWTPVTQSAEFGQLGAHKSWVLGGHLWVLGYAGGGSTGGVWSSTDGATWRLRSTEPGTWQRTAFARGISGDAVWLLGGYWGARGGALNDVWRSSDGIVWSKTTDHAQWSPRWVPMCESLGGTLYLYGGTDGQQSLSDLWSSQDGSTWTPLTPTGTPPGEQGLVPSVVFRGRIYMLVDGRVVYYVP